MIFHIDYRKDGDFMKALQATEHIWWVGALDPDLRVFDIVMHSDHGTSYNS